MPLFYQGQREPLDWEYLNDKIEEFRKKFIFKIVYEEEKKKFSMINWLETLKNHKNIGCNQEDSDRIVKDERLSVDENGNLDNLEKNGDKNNLVDGNADECIKAETENKDIKDELNDKKSLEKTLNNKADIENDLKAKEDVVKNQICQ